VPGRPVIRPERMTGWLGDAGKRGSGKRGSAGG
jgi:hypothetical protein